MSGGSLRRDGRVRGRPLDERLAGYLAAALLVLVVVTIVVTFVLLLVRSSPTSTAAPAVRAPALRPAR